MDDEGKVDTERDAAPPPAHDCADEPGDQSVHRGEGYRGCFSGLDHRVPCTASNATKCQIVASISLWNKFLCWLELELRELPGEGRELGLVQVQNICHVRPTQSQKLQAVTILHWLFNTHRCIESIHLPEKPDDPDVFKMSCAFFLDVMIGNNSVKKVVLNSSMVQSKRLCKVLLSMERLEELRCVSPPRDTQFAKGISALICVTSTLTVLDFKVSNIERALAGLLLNSLRLNLTLKDLTLSSSVVLAEPKLFVLYLSGAVVLKRLCVIGTLFQRDNTLKWICQGMLKNGKVRSLEAKELSLEGENSRVGAKMLAQNKVMQKISLLHSWPLPDLVHTDSWLQAIANNNTLQYMTLSLNVWTEEDWKRFLRLLCRHASLKAVTIVAQEHERSRLTNIVKTVEEIDCTEKVFFKSHSCDDLLSLEECKNYYQLWAAVSAGQNGSVLSIIKELNRCPHLTVLSLEVSGWLKELFWRLVEYVSTTSTLKTFDLCISGTTQRDFPTESHDWWRAFSQSLLRNKSITDLGLGVCLYCRKGVECLGEAVVRSEKIRKIRLLSWLSSAGRRFLRGVRSGVSENYSLCSATLISKHAHMQWASDYYLLCDTARRNLGYVARAAQFLKQARCDTPCAAALDRVHRHPALVAELSKILSVSETDAVVAVRQRFRSIEGMHEFMRLAGVVKEYVACKPRDDDHTQLDALDEHCWAHVRRYLQLDDVAWDCRSRTNAM